jgi:hypothetical protein
MGPVAFLVALPLARRFGWFWAEIPGHVRERSIGSTEWTWEAGRGETQGNTGAVQEGLPIRIFIFAPFIALVLVMVGATAIVALRTADDDAAMLATSLHNEVQHRLRLDDYLARSPNSTDAQLRTSHFSAARQSADGRAFILDKQAKMIASSAPTALRSRMRLRLAQHTGHRAYPQPRRSSSSITSEQNRSRETWRRHATVSFADRN